VTMVAAYETPVIEDIPPKRAIKNKTIYPFFTPMNATIASAPT